MRYTHTGRLSCYVCLFIIIYGFLWWSVMFGLRFWRTIPEIFSVFVFLFSWNRKWTCMGVFCFGFCFYHFQMVRSWMGNGVFLFMHFSISSSIHHKRIFRKKDTASRMNQTKDSFSFHYEYTLFPRMYLPDSINSKRPRMIINFTNKFLGFVAKVYMTMFYLLLIYFHLWIWYVFV